MKNEKRLFSEILVGTLLLIGGIGLLWINGQTNVNKVQAVKYNAVPYAVNK